MRAIALIAVIFYHANPDLFRNGYLGVDIFFLISGFVIAKTLSSRISGTTNGYSTIRIFSQFYKKRFFRLWPALSVTLIATTFLMWIFIPSKFHINFYKLSLSAMVGLANFGAMRFAGNDYFNALPNPVIHTWSLSVEAQLYFVAPILIYTIQRFKSNLLIFIFYVFMILGFVQLLYLNLNSDDTFSSFIFYMPIFRGFEFGLGILAFKFYKTKPKLGNKAYLILLILLCICVMSPTKIYFLDFIVLLITFFLIVCNVKFTNDTWIFRLMVDLGNRSYSLYLVHLPVLYMFKHSPLLDFDIFWLQFLMSIIIILVLGGTLFETIENRFHLARPSESPSQLLKLISYFLILPFLFLALGIAISTNNFFTTKFLSPKINPYQVSPKSDISTACNKIFGTPCQLSREVEQKQEILLVGDSQAASIWKILFELKYKQGLNIFDGSLLGCPFYLDKNFKTSVSPNIISVDCQKRNLNLVNWINLNKPNLVIIKQAEPSRIISHGDYSLSESYYFNSLAWFKSLDLKVIVIGPNPIYDDLDYSLTGSRFIWQRKQYPHKNLTNYAFYSQSLQHNRKLQGIVDSYDFTYQDLYQIFCTSITCSRGNSYGYFYVDNSHLSSLGARKLIPYLNLKIAEIE